jgi:hypothetical protein
MSYQIVLKKSAQQHIVAHKRSGNETLCRKIENLLLELVEHPREGTGKSPHSVGMCRSVANSAAGEFGIPSECHAR